MEEKKKNAQERRTVQAPAPTSVDGAGAVLSVELAADEDVEWTWTHDAAGNSVVTGYRIVPKRDEKSGLGAPEPTSRARSTG
jgi:hypothetical protein